jgi:hypothetical protein
MLSRSIFPRSTEYPLDESRAVTSIWKPELRGNDPFFDLNGYLTPFGVAQFVATAVKSDDLTIYQRFELRGMRSRIRHILLNHLNESPNPDMLEIFLPVQYEFPVAVSSSFDFTWACVAGAKLHGYDLDLDEIHKAHRRIVYSFRVILQSAWYHEALKFDTGLELMNDWLREGQEAVAEFAYPLPQARELTSRLTLSPDYSPKHVGYPGHRAAKNLLERTPLTTQITAAELNEAVQEAQRA